MTNPAFRKFTVGDYDLGATLASGQAFRWQPAGQSWVGVVGRHWVRLTANESGITAEGGGGVSDWIWLADYLQIDLDLTSVLASFPEDEPMRRAVAACRGLRLLRQDPWECLASFILSSTKQIVQIRQIVAVLCQRFGDSLEDAPEEAYSFPSAERLAEATEEELRACKMGFRSPYLRGAARMIAGGEVDLASLGQTRVEEARAQLMRLPGVGRKIADCVLLFAYGFQSAFPVDVWVMEGLRELYFRRRRVGLPRLHRFAAGHFGPHAGYAQQYLFHYLRTQRQKAGR